MNSPISTDSGGQSGALAAPHRILYVIGALDLGGAERHVSYVVPQLARHGISPTVFSLNGRGVLAPDLEMAGVPVVTHWGDHLVKRLPRILRRIIRPFLAFAALLVLIHRLRPHTIHMFLPAAYLLGGTAAILTRVPLRIMSRRSRNHYQRKHLIAARIERLLHRRMSALLGNSCRVLDDLRDEGGQEQKIHLLYNGIPLPAVASPEDKAAYRTEMGISPDALVMVVTANLISYKGHADLLDALAIVRGELGSNWLLLCIGDDRGILNGLKQQAVDIGLANHVRWLGSRRDVQKLLSACDIGILCSHEEGFSNAVLEYMGAELPSVVTDVGGNAEAVINGVCGLVVPPRDVNQLATAVAQLARDRVKRAAMGRAARQRMEVDFTLDTCVEKYMILYDALLKTDESIQKP
jgi:glycosyltransferase involved in cell wall biosynthesis